MTDIYDLTRRTALIGSAALAVSSAQSAEDDIYTPPGLKRELEPDAGKHPRPMLANQVPFNLDDPVSYQLAKYKVQINLVGKTSYLSVMTRHYLCREGVPPMPFANELELFTMYIEQPDPKALPVQRSLFTRCFLDPMTLQPMPSLIHPVSGQPFRLRNTLFALSLPLKLTPEHVMKEPSTVAGTVRETDQRYMRHGKYIDFVPLAIRQGDGPHQPSLDTSTWRVMYDRLMDPNSPLLDAHYSFAAFARASLYAWTGFTKDNPTQMFTTKSGLKVNNVNELPALTKELLAEKYPDRV